jgi:hypothetical protein
MLHRYRVHLFAIQSSISFLIYQLIWVYHISILYLNVSAVLILDCPQQLLLLVFIKHNYDPNMVLLA